MDTGKSVKFNGKLENESTKKKQFAKTPGSRSFKKSVSAKSGQSAPPGRKLNFGEPTPNKEKVILTAEERQERNTKNTIFVGNLPAAITHEDVKECFSIFGEIENARVRCLTLSDTVRERKAAVILKEIAGTTASAYVRFANEKGVQNALKANGAEFEGRHLRIDLASPTQKDNKKAVFLRNISHDATEDDLWKLFKDCGSIDSAKILRSRGNYEPRGLGYVNFKGSESVELALKLDGTELHGRPIKVLPSSQNSQSKEKPNGVFNKTAVQGRMRRIQMKMAKKRDAEAAGFSGNKAAVKKKGKKMDVDKKKKKKIAEILSHKSTK